MVDGGLLNQGANWQMLIYADGRVEGLSRLVLWPFTFGAGQSIFVYRLHSAFLGLLAVSAGGLAARMFFIRYPASVGRQALLAAIVALSANQGFMTLSRAIYRTGLTVPLLLMFFALSWYGLHQLLQRRLAPFSAKSLRIFIGAGACLGIIMHTYTSAYVAALLGPLLGVYLVLTQLRQWRLWLGPMVMMGLAFLIFTSPLLYTLATNPDRVLARSSDVASEENQMLLEQTLRLENTDYVELQKEWTLIRYTRKGDLNPQYNTSRAPLMPHGTKYLFYAGLLICTLLLFRYEAGQLWALLILSLVPVMLSNELFHGLRIILGYALVPLLCGLCIGMAQYSFELLSRYWRPIRYASVILIAGMAVYLGSEVHRIEAAYQAFFLENNPAGEPRQPDEPTLADWYFRAQDQAMVAYFRERGESVYIPLEVFNRSDVRANLLQDYPVARSWTDLPLDANQMPLLPKGYLYTVADYGNLTTTDYRLLVLAQGDSLYILPPLADDSAVALKTSLETAGEAHFARDRLNWLVGQSLELLDPATAIEFIPITPIAPVIFGDRIQVVGVTKPDEVMAGEETSYCIIWQPIRAIERNKVAVVELWDYNGNGLVGLQDNNFLRWIYPTSAWKAGDLIPTCYRFTLPADSQPGLYWLSGAIVEPFFAAWEARDEAGNLLSPYSARIAPLKVSPQTETLPIFETESGQGWNTPDEQTITLLGYDLAGYTEGGQLHLTSYWQASGSIGQNYTLFAHFTSPNGAIIAQHDGQPQEGRYPTSIWASGEVVRVDITLTLPSSLPDQAQLMLGWYDPITFQRLPLQTEGNTDGNETLSLPLPN